MRDSVEIVVKINGQKAFRAGGSNLVKAFRKLEHYVMGKSFGKKEEVTFRVPISKISSFQKLWCKRCGKRIYDFPVPQIGKNYICNNCGAKVEVVEKHGR